MADRSSRISDTDFIDFQGENRLRVADGAVFEAQNDKQSQTERNTGELYEDERFPAGG